MFFIFILPLVEAVKKYYDELTKLSNDYYDTVVRYAKQHLHKKQDVEDAVEETFKSIYEKCESIFTNPHYGEEKYLWSILHDEARKVCRRINYDRDKRNQNVVYLDDDDEYVEPVDTTMEFTPERELEIYEAWEIMNELPEKHGQVLRLTAYEWSSSEIANCLGITVNNVDQIRHRAKVKYKERLKQKGLHKDILLQTSAKYL